VIVGMYHDQVLAPFKALYGYDAINLTLGLKYLRVSPDHGTAQDIVGLNKANPQSLINAINFLNKIND
jgi:4-hydroxy-L-threonine phosphate dehydrogenase PdxA